MSRITSRSWTADDVVKLARLVDEGASPFRASAALRRTMKAVQLKAKENGTPFPRRKRRAFEKERLAAGFFQSRPLA